MILWKPFEENRAKFVASSLDLSSSQDSSECSDSSSSTDAEENDLEHTEYSVTPLIRSSISISRGSAKEMIRGNNLFNYIQ